MASWNTLLVQHGYSMLAAAVFLETIGLPVPAALALLIAGGAAARGILQVPNTVGVALLSMLAGDTLMFMLGRYTGWWLLGVLCRISLNPESCILRSADSFYRRGRMLLVVAKFIPGINTIAPPLAGSMNMRAAPFLRLDLAGAALYIGAYFGVGFIFSDAVDTVTRGYNAAGRVLGRAVTIAIACYVVYRVWLLVKGRLLGAVPLISPAEAAEQLAAGAHIYDVRSHGYLDAKAVRIQGSRRLDPNALHQSQLALPRAGTVSVYCTCLRQATSARVARELQRMLEGKAIRITVIRGGLRAWTKAGLPVEGVPAEELAALPVFE